MDAMKIMTEGMVKENRPEFSIGDTVRVSVRIKEGEKERIQAFAEANGETVNGFINRLIAEAMGVLKTDDGNDDL